jgi:hypothetical protein
MSGYEMIEEEEEDRIFYRGVRRFAWWLGVFCLVFVVVAVPMTPWGLWDQAAVLLAFALIVFKPESNP